MIDIHSAQEFLHLTFIYAGATFGWIAAGMFARFLWSEHRDRRAMRDYRPAWKARRES